MGITERKERERERRRAEILDAAEKVFFSNGIENATMDEVASTAELSKGTLYLYFKNKNELLHGIVGRALEVLLNLFKKNMAGKKTGLEKVEAMGKAYFDFYRQSPDYFSIMLHRESYQVEMSALQDSPNFTICNRLGDEIFQLMEEVVSQGIQDGSIRQDIDPFKLSMVLWGHTSGVLNLIRTKEIFFETKFHLSVQEFYDYSHLMIKTYLQNPEIKENV